MPRILVFGRPKKGKTRFCATAPDVLILDPEDGTKEEKSLNPSVWPVDGWSDVVDAYNFLKTTDQYKWVCLDSFFKIYTQLLHWLMRTSSGEMDLEKVPKSVQIQSYGKANEMVKGMLQNLHALRQIGLIITCQERLVSVETVDDIDDDEAEATTYQIVPDLPKGARAAVTQIVDLSGRLYVVAGEFERSVRRRGEVETITETRQRRLWVGVDDRYETGYRSVHQLPDFLPNPTVKSVMRALRQGVSENG
jgi:hypothetical protein